MYNPSFTSYNYITKNEWGLKTTRHLAPCLTIHLSGSTKRLFHPQETYNSCLYLSCAHLWCWGVAGCTLHCRHKIFPGVSGTYYGNVNIPEKWSYSRQTSGLFPICCSSGSLKAKYVWGRSCGCENHTCSRDRMKTILESFFVLRLLRMKKWGPSLCFNLIPCLLWYILSLYWSLSVYLKISIALVQSGGVGKFSSIWSL